MTKTTYAKLTWDEQGQPVSTEFDDIYFSKTSGLDETYYVFLKHNNLLERFRNLKIITVLLLVKQVSVLG